MKKTLLCFLFLFTSFFYAQVTNVTVCGGEAFNLTSVNAAFTGSLDPTTPVTYFLNLDDALNNTNEITDPTNYYGAIGATKIYGRLNDNGTIAVNFFELTVYPRIIATASHIPISCKGGLSSLTVNVVPGGTYYYSLNGSSFTTNKIYNNLPAGVYNIKVQSPNPICPDVNISYTITEPNAITAVSTTSGQSVMVTAAGGTAPYQYSKDGTTYQSSSVFSGLASGNYNIRVKDSRDCIYVMPVITIVVPDTLATAAVITKQLDCISGATIVANATGGQPPYTYSVNGGATYQTSNTFANILTGTFTIRVKDAVNTISVSNSVTVTPPTAVNVNTFVTLPDCINNNATITVSATGGQAPYIYSRDNGTTYVSSNTFTNVLPGTYRIVVQDSKGCLSPFLITTIQPYSPLIVTASNTSILCNEETASLTISATGGRAPYQYSINNGNSYTSSNTYSTLSAGTYTIKVKDALGCVSTIDHIINQPTILSVVLATSNADITLTTSGGTAPYQYSLDGGSFQTNNVFRVVTSGNYIVQVRDSNGCVRTFATAIVIPNPLTSSTIIAKEMDCISGATIAVNAFGGQAPYSYSIDGGMTYQTINAFTNIPAGVYTVKVKDIANTISNSNTITVAAPRPVIATTLVTPTDCTNKATIRVQAIEGQQPYIYSLDGGAYTSGNTFYGVSPGNYLISVKDSKACVSIVNVTVQPLVPLAVTASNTPILCNGETSSLTINVNGGQAPYEYSINNGVYTSSNTFTSLNSGAYTIKVKDALGCSSELNYVITEPIALSANLNVEGQTVTINGQGGTVPYQYSVNHTDFFSENVFTNLSPGEHTVFLKDTNGCESSYNITIANPTPLSSTAAITKPLNCGVKATITVTASGGIAPYQYSIDGGLTYKTTNVFTTLNAGTYNAVVKDVANTISNTTTIVIDPLIPLVVDVAILKPLDCTGSATIKATVTGGVTPYLYSIDNGPYSPTNTLNLYVARDYTVNILDNAGCIVRKVITISPYAPIVMSTVITNVSCYGQNNGLIRVTATSGNAPFTYSIGAGYQSGNIFSNLAPGNYTVSVKDNQGCIVTKSATITQPTALISSINTTNTTCFNSATGTITVNASGGTIPYTYSINGTNYFSNKTFNNLSAGIYNVSVKDSKGCSMSFYTTISQPNALAINLTKTDITCYGSQDGTIVINATGGNAPYTYSIGSVYTSSNVFSNLAPGQYNVTAKDIGGCITTSSIIIAQPTALLASVSVLNPTSSINSDGKITVAASGGIQPYYYSLQNSNGTIVIPPQNFNVFNNILAGSYIVQVTDARGCTFSQSGINIISSSALVATTSITPLTCNSNGAITVTAMGGIAPYQYSFDNGITYTFSNHFIAVTPGNYTVKVRDAQNNETTIVVVIDPVNPVNIIATIVSPITCSQNGVITANVIGGEAPYVYSLNGSSFQNSSFFNVTAGTHTISVRDSYGCTAISAIDMIAPEPVVASLIVENQNVTITTIGGSGNFSYAISPNLNVFTKNNTFTNLEAGNYTVIVMNANGCYVMMYFVIDPPAPLIEGKDVVTVEFKPGQTLADLIVEGENIQWYSTQNSSEWKTSKANETPLPLTTVLIDGTTYYASQTINGIISKERLAVTAKIKSSLSTPDFVLPNFTYYPNPVQHTLNINNTSNIDEVEIFSVSGKSILSKKINNDHSEIDLSNVSSGFYFLKVKSEGKTKTIKIVKK